MAYEIEDGVSIPKRTAGRHGSKYPFAQMDVGQSFLITADVKASTIRSAVGAFCKRNPGTGKFAVRGTEDGLRVWRTE